MPIVEVNGQELEFPDDMQPAAIREVLRKKFPVANDSQQPSMLQDIIKAEIGGEQTAPETAFQIMGAIAKPAANKIREVTSHLTPQFIDDAMSYVGGKIDPALPELSPRQARNLAAAGDVSTVAGTGALALKGTQALMSGDNIASRMMKDQSSAGMMNKARESFENRRANFVQDLILPKQTPKEIAETALQRSSGGGIMNAQVYTPNPREAEIIKTVASTGVKKGKPLVDNLQILNKAKNSEAQKLKFALEKMNTPISSDALNRANVSVIDNIAANPLVDENSATVRKILETAQAKIESAPKTAAGILQARKDFDRAIEKFQPSAFDTDAPATAFRYTVKQIRQGMNDIIEQSVPDVGVRESLARQSHLYEAMDNIGTKLYKEKTNRFGRFFDTGTGKAVKYGAGAAAAYGAGSAGINAIKGQ